MSSLQGREAPHSSQYSSVGRVRGVSRETGSRAVGAEQAGSRTAGSRMTGAGGATGAAGRDASRVGNGERGACVGSGRLGAPRSSPPMEMVPRSMVCIICLLNFGSAGHSPHDTRCHMMRRILRVHTPFYVMSGCCDTGWGNLFFTKCKKRLTTACRGVYYSINDML